jgi:ABC-type Mn2+/Zn2+ transport system ATPase subunit
MCLGKILLQDPDVLLLDEPTNHLDLDAIEWLEGYVKELEIPTVIVSHDREFLDQVQPSCCCCLVLLLRSLCTPLPPAVFLLTHFRGKDVILRAHLLFRECQEQT